MRKSVFQICIIGVFGCFTACNNASNSNLPREVIFTQRVIFDNPPSRIPASIATDAPFLGNGFTGIAVSGKPEKQVYYIARNDFWRLKSSMQKSYPAVLGKLEIEIPEIEGASYLLEQNLYEAKTYSRFVKGDKEIHFKSYVSAVEDLMIIEISNSGEGDIEGSISLELPGEQEFDDNLPSDLIFPTLTDKGKTPDGIYYITRAFEKDVDIPTKAASAFSILENVSNEFKLSGGKSVLIALAFSSNFKSDDCLQTVIKRLNGLKKKDLGSIEKKHELWWKDYWSKSSIDINDSLIERQYYLSNYNLACFSRDKGFPPSIFGTCITKEPPAWNGDYHLNYNHLAPYYGLFSSNHIEQAIPCNMPILAAQQRGEYYSDKICGIQGGILLPVGIGPLGIETTRKNEFMTKNWPDAIKKGYVEDEGLFLGQKSNSSYCIVNMANHFYTTYDEEYTKQYYPFVKGVATFWENYLVFENGRYVIYNDAIHEGSLGDMNPILSLGLIRLVMQTAIDMSTELKLDLNRREKWQHVKDHLSDYSYQIREGKKVFRYTEKGLDWWNDNTLGIQHIYPGGQIGLDSEPELLKIAHNTIDVMQRWNDNNGSNSFFPAAVRIGYDGDTILKKLHGYIENTYPNGYQLNNPHGIENLSTVPNTINEMLCMGHGNVLRVFPVWPKNRNAAFSNIRIYGAFLVSSQLINGEVQHIEILSEKGKTCNLFNPWRDRPAVIIRSDGVEESMEGDILEIRTSAGERISIKPVQVPDNLY